MSTASAASVQLKVGPPTALSPEDFIMGSAGNWQTENGIVMNAEERCVCVPVPVPVPVPVYVYVYVYVCVYVCVCPSAPSLSPPDSFY